MKKTLLICNTVLYAIMYSLSLFFVGFMFGDNYAFAQRAYDGVWVGLPLLWKYFLYPAAFFIYFLIGLHFVKCSENLSVKSFVILGTVTWIPFFVYLMASKSVSISEPMHWFKVGIFILATVIFIIDIICAILTYKENQALEQKT